MFVFVVNVLSVSVVPCSNHFFGSDAVSSAREQNLHCLTWKNFGSTYPKKKWLSKET